MLLHRDLQQSINAAFLPRDWLHLALNSLSPPWPPRPREVLWPRSCWWHFEMIVLSSRFSLHSTDCLMRVIEPAYPIHLCLRILIRYPAVPDVKDGAARVREQIRDCPECNFTCPIQVTSMKDAPTNSTGFESLRWFLFPITVLRNLGIL